MQKLNDLNNPWPARPFMPASLATPTRAEEIRGRKGWLIQAMLVSNMSSRHAKLN